MCVKSQFVTWLSYHEYFYRYTYGVAKIEKFNEMKHDPKRKVVRKDGSADCEGVFSIHVKKNTVVRCGEYQVKKCYVSQKAGGIVNAFELYASENENPKYVDESGCFHLGQVSIVPPEGKTNEEKTVELRLKFGTTTLEATATAVKTGKSVTSCFELSS